ncbi:hypothetical protein PG997_007282 [Apiospora hydei]|uniref:Clr5 domain-containing protein n=1 Tax=Apiospora hydei TaxID=1337664 RepID=A0ABR1W7L3_9PEZI
MAALPPSRPSLEWQPRDYTVWDANRDRIYEIYLVEKKGLRETKRLMEARHAFPEFDNNMWEHVLLRHFGFRKNLSKADWVPIGQSLAKRRRLGKNNHAIDLCGAKIPIRRVEKNVPRQVTLLADSPELPRDILIRTPPPDEPFASRALQRRVNMSDLPLASSSGVAFMRDMLPEWILEVRKNSPFNQTMHRLILSLESHFVTDNVLRQSFASLSQMYQMYPSPSKLGTSSSLDILSYACFSMSRGSYFGFPEPLPLLNWIRKIADLRFLQAIFSTNTPTLLELWSTILQVAWKFRNLDAFKSLTEVGLRVTNRQWARFCLDICCHCYCDMDERFLNQSLLSSTREVIESQWVSNDKRPSAHTLWDAAARYLDIDMMKILASLGYHFSELPAKEQQHCLQHVSGATAAPVLDDGIYWDGPHWPVLARDFAWVKGLEGRFQPSLLEEFSLRDDETVTASGIYRAASGGCASLKHYMETTPCPTIEVRAVLLEITLSQTTACGCCEVLDCLLDYGVDPNAPSLGRNKLAGPRHASLHCHESFISVLSQETEDSWIVTIKLLETFGLNPQRFGDSEVVQAALFESTIRRKQLIIRLLEIFKLGRELELVSLDAGTWYSMASQNAKMRDQFDCAASPNHSTRFFDLRGGGCWVRSRFERPRQSDNPFNASNFRQAFDMALGFIRRGADVNAAISYDLSGWSGKGYTALHFACISGAPLPFLETLLDLGAQVDAGSELGVPTSLCYAIAAGHLNIMSLLIAHGAAINVTVRDGDTNRSVWNLIPEITWSHLDLAAAMGDLEITQLLYDFGTRSACQVFTEVDGAVQVARRHRRLGVFRFFEERVEGLDRIPDRPELD